MTKEQAAFLSLLDLSCKNVVSAAEAGVGLLERKEVAPADVLILAGIIGSIQSIVWTLTKLQEYAEHLVSATSSTPDKNDN